MAHLKAPQLGQLTASCSETQMEPRTACWMVLQMVAPLSQIDGGTDGKQPSSLEGVADGLTAGTLCGDTIDAADGALDGVADSSVLCDGSFDGTNHS
jgi:hypothetical protein